MGKDIRWVWTSPNGRITHTYTPQNSLVYMLYRLRGWTLHGDIA